MVDYLKSDRMFEELQREASFFSHFAPPIKLVITDEDLPNIVDGFGTTIVKFNPDSADVAERLEHIVQAVYKHSREGVCQWRYQDYPQYECCFVDVNKMVIDWPNKGQVGGTVFDIYQHAISEDAKQKVARSVARKLGVRCAIIEGQSSGFLIERIPGGEYLYQLASACECTVVEVLRRIRLGWPLTPPTPEILEKYRKRLYFFIRYESGDGESFKMVGSGCRKVSDPGDIVSDIPDADAYTEPRGVKLSDTLIEVRYRPADITFDADGEPTTDWAAVASACGNVPFQMGYKRQYVDLGGAGDS